MRFPVPSFNEYANACAPGTAVEFAMDAPSFTLDVERFAAEAIASGADFAVVVSPNNPTSLLVPHADLLCLLGLLEGHDCMLLVDESCIDFFERSVAESLEKDLAEHQNLAVIKSMSKAYGICGLRIGYLATANLAFAERVRDGLHIWNLNGFAEAFLRLAPSYRQDFVESCDSVRADGDAFYVGLCTIPGLTVYKPDANFIFCRLPDHAPAGPEVALNLFVEHNILIKDMAGKTMPEADRYIRVACRTEPENAALTAVLMGLLGGEDAW
ncbi:MAG: aminotransferase class I/II-fold pyridoxal phosphate-dependent enzyme [Coriobacteriia bacterium]|nr:aminotransferase class I/II-fold pyridoxal phosphate-dependent enzyme [Coriobacteriia bacterium]